MGRLTRNVEIALVAGLMAVGAVLRFKSLDGGLPFPTNVDELGSDVLPATRIPITGLHREIMFYPGAYMYLCYLVFGLLHGFGSGVTDTLSSDPTALLHEARAISAVAGTLTLPVLWLVARRSVGRTAALFALAIATFMFLPVAYSHMSLDDSLLMFAVTLCVGATVEALRSGRLVWFVAAGAAAGFATGSKYTGGFILAAPLVAAILRARGDGSRTTAIRLAAGATAALAVFAVTTPYAFLHPRHFMRDVQALNWINSHHWLGEPQQHASIYYLWSLRWGFGVLPLVAAIVGFVMLFRRDRRLALVLLVPTVLLFTISITKATYFARFLMPAYPLMIIAAATACAIAMHTVATKLLPARIAAPAAALLLAGAMVAEGAIHSIHFDRVWSRPDTWTLAAEWVRSNIPKGSPLVVDRWVTAWWPSRAGSPGYDLQPKFGIAGRAARRKGLIPDSNTAAGAIVGLSSRSASLDFLDRFERERNCWVMTSSFQAGRAMNDPVSYPDGVVYYNALHGSRGVLVFQASPFDDHSRAERPEGPVHLNYDWAINDWPLYYERPGPLLSIYWLKSCGPSPVPAFVPGGGSPNIRRS